MILGGLDIGESKSGTCIGRLDGTIIASDAITLDCKQTPDAML